MAKMTTAQIAKVAESTTDAYSFDRFTNWKACVKTLARLGYDARQAEAILRSKHMRWCGDAAGKYDGNTSADLVRYLATAKISEAALAELVAGTFNWQPQ